MTKISNFVSNKDPEPLETPAAAQGLQSCRAAEHSEDAWEPHGLESLHGPHKTEALLQ